MLHFKDIIVFSVPLAAGCFLYRSWEALLIGTIGAIIACVSMPLIDRMRIDDPVGASSVHGNTEVYNIKWVCL
jgi:ammonia channel protein AmtB